MNSNPQEYLNSPKVEAIDSSLNMLRQLQARLKYTQQSYSPFSKKHPQAYTHTRIRTQPYSFTQRSQHSPHHMAINESQLQQLKSHLPNNYSHSQPTMIQYNQNQFGTVKDIIKENRKLKKYVNCLLQMNDYLKNQLVKKDYMGPANKMGHSFELQLMKMQIQYLKQLNRDKQLDLRRFQHLGSAVQIPSRSKHKSKKKSFHERTPSFQESNHHHQKSHNRSASVYDVIDQKKSHPNVSQFNVPYEYKERKASSDEQSSQRIMKSMHLKNSHNKAPPSSKKNSNSSVKYSNDSKGEPRSNKKKKTNGKAQSNFKKCRLCYF